MKKILLLRKTVILVLNLCFILLIVSCNVKSGSETASHSRTESNTIDSVHVILMPEDIVFCVKENRSAFFENFREDDGEMFCDSMIYDSDEINEMIVCMKALPATDTLSYYSSQISYEMNKTGDKVRFLENSMDNRGVILIYHRDSLEFVWLSETAMERGNVKYEMTEDFKVFLRKLRKVE